ncbi:MAG: DsrE/DsrF/DrsH-like family protein [Chloroflexota bacterium]|nr:DsrE/DsrF/DrsH-like family protein [Chloroflexota bacterium]
MVDERLAEADRKRTRRKKIALIATKGTLDWAYPPLILASTAASLGWDAGIFFTFYGLNIIHKKKREELAIAPIANPAMPMPVPLPNLLGAIPGMTPFATFMMKRMFRTNGVASIRELTDVAIEAGAKLFPCGMTMQVFGYRADDLLAGCQPVCGAAAFLSYASDADVTLAF